MKTEYISENELMQMFIETMLQDLIAQSVYETLDKNIIKAPKKCQNEIR